MNQVRSTISVLLIFLISASCTEEVTMKSGNFVVEGFIVANEAVNNIKIKDISPIESEEVTSEAIPTATVSISQGTSTFPLIFNDEKGLYEYPDEDLFISNQESYSISITVGDRTATSTTIVPDPPTGLSVPKNTLVVPELSLGFGIRNEIAELFQEERITLEWDAREGQSYFVVIENRAATPDPILPDGIPEEAIDLLSSFRFISAPSEQTTFDIIAVALETYGPHIAKVFTVNQEYVDLFENLEQDSRDLNEPPSNVFNALGIFTAFAVDSVTFEVVKP